MSRETPGTGSGNYVNVGDVAAIDITGTALTIHCWILLNSLVSNATFVNKMSDSVASNQYLLDAASIKLRANIFASDGTTDTVSSVASITTGVWHPAGMVKNGTGAGALSVWLDAVKAAIASNRVIQNGTAPLLFNDRPSSGIRTAGRIAEVAIWDVALTDAEMAVLAQGVSPLMFRRDHLRGYWPLFGVAYPEPDLSGNGNHAVQVGTVPAAAHAPVQPFASIAA